MNKHRSHGTRAGLGAGLGAVGMRAVGARRLARVGACTAAVALAAGLLRRRSHERARPGPGPRRRAGRWEHPEETGAREPDDFGAEGERLTAHELKGYGNLGTRPAPRRSAEQDDGDDSGGAFGSGGHGG